jgi:hypothetical protein
MKASLLSLLLLLFSACASLETPGHPSGLEVTERGPDKGTAITKQNLLHLAQVYDLSPFLFTKRIVIDSAAVPTAKPVLTLGTQDAEEPKRILATLLHQELDWWLDAKASATAAAIDELRKIYPKVPKAEAQTAHRTLLLCYLEFRALEFYVGQNEARAVIEGLMKKAKRSPWAYYQVLHRGFVVRKVVETQRLYPPPLNGS